MKNLNLLSGLLLTFLLFAGACNKSTPITYISLQNNTYTTLYATVNSKSISIAPGAMGTFGAYPNTAVSGQVYTSGGTNASPIGLTLNWNLNGYYFPASGTTVIPIDVSADYFFLFLKNNSPLATKLLEVNYGTSYSTAEYITVPNDNNQYSIGYYNNLNGGNGINYSNARITMTDNSYYTINPLVVPLQIDAQYSAWLH
jgi:hypothetical protein